MNRAYIIGIAFFATLLCASNSMAQITASCLVNTKMCWPSCYPTPGIVCIDLNDGDPIGGCICGQPSAKCAPANEIPPTCSSTASPSAGCPIL